MDAIDTIKVLGSLLGSGGLSKGSGGNVLGNILGSALGQSSQQQTQGGGMLGDILGNLMGGGNAKTTTGGSLGDLLGGLMKGQNQTQQSQGGGLGDLLGSLLKGQNTPAQAPATQSSGMGDILGNLLGGGSQSSSGATAGGLGGLLTGALAKYMQSQHADQPNPTPESADHLPQGVNPQDAMSQANILIKAMINAAKSDGQLDEHEQQKILAKLGELSPSEIAFLKKEFSEPLDIDAFVKEVPRGLEQQVYALSLSAIDLDTNKEARYLAELGQKLGISPEMANAIHEHLGAPKLYA